MRLSHTFIEYLPSQEYISRDTGRVSTLPDEAPLLEFFPSSLCEQTPILTPELVSSLRSRRQVRLVEASTPRTTRTPRSHRPAKPSTLESDPTLLGLDPKVKEMLLKALTRKGKR